jgi:4-oxalocrotonate tautomerase
MPIVQISMLPGRTREQKRAMIKAVTEAIVRTANAPAQTVRVIITEVPPEHWAVGGLSKAEEAEQKAGSGT